MCAYNVRKNRRVDHDPPTGPARTAHLVREVLIWVVGLVVMYLVYRLVRRYLLF